MKQFLITGGAGFIGSHLADFLIARGDGVTVLDNLSTGRKDNVPVGAELLNADIAAEANPGEIFSRIDGCFHLAAIASVQQYRDEWQSAVRTNLLGSAALLSTAARFDVPVVYASSAAVYGENPNVPLAESTSLLPISGYGADKLGMELHARAMQDMLGLRSVGLRFFNVYGPRQPPGSPYSGVISIFLDRLGTGRALAVYGDGEQVRDFVFVSDVVDGLCRAMDKAIAGTSGVFNICSGSETSINQLALTLGAMPGFEARIEYQPGRAGDIKRSLGNPGLAFDRLGFKARTSLEDGLARTASWFAANGGGR